MLLTELDVSLLDSIHARYAARTFSLPIYIIYEVKSILVLLWYKIIYSIHCISCKTIILYLYIYGTVSAKISYVLYHYKIIVL